MLPKGYEILLYTQKEAITYSKQLFDDFFFTQEVHLLQQNPLNLPFRFYLVQPQKQQVVAKCSFFIEQGQALSPLKASFGGIVCDAQLSPELLLEFILGVENHLKAQNVQKISLRMYPDCYHPEMSSLVHYALRQLEYQIICTDLNYHLPLSASSLEAYLHPSKKRVLKKCRKAGFYFQPIETPDLSALHTFIEEARLRKGYPMTLSSQAFQDLVGNFAEHFLFFEVKSPLHTSAAVMVTIVINSHILYNFYPADSSEWTSFSPLVLLNTELYHYAKTAGFQLIDLGIATDKGQLNAGLSRFKAEIGAKKSLKFTFSKNL